MDNYNNKCHNLLAFLYVILIASTFFPFIALLGFIPGLKLKKCLEVLSKNYIDASSELEKQRKELDYKIKENEIQAKQIIENAEQEAKKIVNRAKNQNEYFLTQNKALQQEKVQLTSLISELESTVTSKYIDVENYDNITSEECKNQLALLKMKEKDLIAADEALKITSEDNKKAINNNIKQILRCFNAECANLILNISTKNIDSVRNKISKSFETLNKIFSTDGIELSTDLLALKLESATLLYEYELKKEQEKEQQRAIKEKMIEEEKVRREIEHEKQKIEKEETQFKNEIDKLMKYMQKSQDEIQNQLYIDKIKELEDKLKSLEKDKENVLEREQNTRAGFVYIISNIGSFGENIYKIGMTRRLEPMDRIKELGDASVPFSFDVHALIFSDDAPALENILHETFRQFEVNKINHRKEFFKIDLEKIKSVVLENHNSTVNFIDIPAAEEYRQSLEIKESA